MFVRSLGRSAFVCLLAAIGSIHLLAQFESSTVLGTVHDASGANVSEAVITLVNTKTGVDLKGKSDSNGNYEFANVRIGEYEVRVESTGFQTSTTSPFTLQIGARQRVDINLEVGQATQNVTVTDAVSVLETDSSSRGQVINPQQIVGLPLNGRAYADLALLTPGVAKSPLQNQSDSSRDASFNVNGQRSAYNNFLLDGIDNNAYGTSNQGFSNQVVSPSPDALAEFKVQTDNYSAEFGRATGAVVNATVKSGTNQIHGAAWDFLRNTSLNSVGFFRPASGVKPTLIQNQFGGAIGGPILKDKIFLFGDYEGFRRVQRSVSFATLPTAAQRNGNLGNFPIRNPQTGRVYSNGQIPVADMSQFSRTVFSQLPLPNLSGAGNNYQTLPRSSTDTDKGDIRYDQYIGQKLTTFVRYSQNDNRTVSAASIDGPAGGNSNGNVFVRNKQIVPGATWTISPTSILEVRVGIDYTEAGKTALNQEFPSDVYNIPNLPTDPTFAGGLYSLSLQGGISQFGRQGSNPQSQNPFVVDPKVNFIKILGRHSLKMGFEYQAINTEVRDFHPKYGSDSYGGFFSSPTGGAGLNSAQQQAFSLADFMFGLRSNYQLTTNGVSNLRQRMYFGYLQDDYRVNSKLTLNLGVRYEFGTPQWERDNRLTNFNPVNGSIIQATGGSIYNRALVNPDRNNWAPRIGLAYQVTPKTVIRSGYGISYIHFNRLGGENLLAYNGPNIVNGSVDQSINASTRFCTSVNDAPGACLRNTSLGFPNNFTAASNFNPANTLIRYIPGSLRTGYVQNWHFSIQRELAKNFLLDVGYVGNHTVGIMILGDANQAQPNLPGQSLSLVQRRPYRSFNTIQQAYNGGFGSYNALQVKVEKRYDKGFSFLNSFTYSKALDNAPGHLESYSGDNSRINIFNQRGERGVSLYDQTLNNVTSILYDLPFGRGRHYDIQNRALDLIAGGWGVNVINTLSSGLPINITYTPSAANQVSTLLSPRPNLIGNPVTPEGQRDQRNYLNSASFTTPSPSQFFGSAGRNIARGYPLYQLDFGLHKNFALWSESSHIEFRTEAFNLLNQTNFSNPASNFGSANFGSITSTFPSRQIQFALKLVF